MIRTGNVTKVTDLKEFRQRLSVEWTEILTTFNDSDREEILEEINHEREYDDLQPVENIEDGVEFLLEENAGFVIEEHVTSRSSTYNVIVDVLDARTTEYVHLYNGHHHTIIELFPRDSC